MLAAASPLAAATASCSGGEPQYITVYDMEYGNATWQLPLQPGPDALQPLPPGAAAAAAALGTLTGERGGAAAAAGTAAVRRSCSAGDIAEAAPPAMSLATMLRGLAQAGVAALQFNPQQEHEQQQQPVEAPETAPASKEAAQAVAAEAHEHHEDDSYFECNICLELAKEPVVTLCGHLYCWPCLYRWTQTQTYSRACPVCKAGVELDKVVPIYGRSSEPAKAQETMKVPPRPAGQRPAPVTPSVPAQQQQGVLPSLFGFHLGPGQGYNEALTPEQQHQAFLSRLLLMLGSFVIMCLLLF
ncbi:hypothetical protein GPECTOR_15g361 [Gonium pectorale]|uniref:RING-type E3 ubiquitin transferase n=1 Tax=Gonium pectorale TaxID=33097 RepID=A0A150GLK9_GONPE|nr:hypothetical protein GPECTOR_15g361 [Gonium pectorale]|eukprot:KXZ50677.1 hypothetical protein GPECTOR_15g361 [Gonium pectorale]